jgi:hypothetical protein
VTPRLPSMGEAPVEVLYLKSFISFYTLILVFFVISFCILAYEELFYAKEVLFVDPKSLKWLLD